MEIVVSIFVGILGAGATIIAAYIQTRRTNLYTATDHKELQHEVKVSLDDRQQTTPLNIRQPGSQHANVLTIQSRTAFFEDLGCDPFNDEVLLFHRRATFKTSQYLK